MTLANWARKLGISWKTAYRLWRAGELDAFQLPTGSIIVWEDNGNDGLKKKNESNKINKV